MMTVQIEEAIMVNMREVNEAERAHRAFVAHKDQELAELEGLLEGLRLREAA